MIKANELRIGNWLSVNEDGPDVNKQIIYIGKDTNGFNGYFINFGAMSVSLEGREDNVTPIPLTPEILGKCRFEVNNYSCYRHTSKEGYIFYSRKDAKTGFAIEINEDEDTEAAIYLDCKYLHQLQNLYFALTGEELECAF